MSPFFDSEIVRNSGASITLIRHPQTDWNLEKRYQSHSDRPLTTEGERQLGVLVDAFADQEFDRIVSTGLQRTDRVAARLAKSRGAGLPHIDEGWRECHHGKWEGLTYSQVSECFPEAAEQRFAELLTSRAHGGENLRDVWKRVRERFEQLLSGEAKSVVVVTHATPIQLVLCAQAGTPLEEYWRFQIDHGSVTQLDAGPDGLSLRRLNYCPWLNSSGDQKDD